MNINSNYKYGYTIRELSRSFKNVLLKKHIKNSNFKDSASRFRSCGITGTREQSLWVGFFLLIRKKHIKTSL